MDDKDAKGLAIAILGLICLVVFLTSPLGDVLGDLLGLIPGEIWAWIFGLAALIGLIAVILYFT